MISSPQLHVVMKEGVKDHIDTILVKKNAL